MDNKTVLNSVVDVPLELLVPHPANPFGLYSGQRFDDLVESVEANGVLVPILARPSVDEVGKFEMLSGHNRFEALKFLGRETAPVIVREGLSDDEALFIVVETNLIQRSFSDFSPTERAATIAIHYDSLKSQGRRTDLIEEVRAMLGVDSGVAESTSDTMYQKLDSRKSIGKDFGMSSALVARYLRINKLILSHKNRLNSGAMSMIAAVSLSFLCTEEQELVDEVLVAGRYKLSLKEAEILRDLPKPLTLEAIRMVVQDSKRQARSEIPVTLEPAFLSRYFSVGENRDEIRAVIAKALEMYLGAKSD